MKKKLIAIAVGAAAVMPALALADVSIYGRAHVSVDFLDDGADYSETNLSSNSSRIGFKGDHEINPSLKAFFQIEQEINFATGSNGSNSFATRDTFVGLKGDFGAVQMGRFDSPFKRARGPANLFGDQVGDMRNLTRVGNARFDERNANTIHYQTSSFSNMQFNLAYSISEAITAEDGAKDESISLSFTFATGPVDLAVAYEGYGEDHSRGERNAFRAAIGYDVISPLKLVAFFQTVDQEDNDALTSDMFGFGAEYKLTSKTRLRGHYMLRSSDIDDADAGLLAIGVEHRIDSKLRLYVNYA